jgi:ribosomal protein S13
MKKSSELIPTKKDLEKVKFIVLDIDGVTVPRGTKIKEISHNLKMRVREIPDAEIKQIKKLSEKGYLIGVIQEEGFIYCKKCFMMFFHI